MICQEGNLKKNLKKPKPLEYALVLVVKWEDPNSKSAHSLKPSIGMIFGCDDFRSGPMFADNYRLLAIIAIIAINRDYCQNCEKITSIINIIIVITSQLSANYHNYLAIIAISRQGKELPTEYRARNFHDCLPAVKLLRALPFTPHHTISDMDRPCSIHLTAAW